VNQIATEIQGPGAPIWMAWERSEKVGNEAVSVLLEGEPEHERG
jgi:hypothetical protein